MAETSGVTTFPKGYKRNVILLIGNYVAFGLGLAFFSANTVMPVFLSHLTQSKPLIGLVSAIFPLGWMIPQLFSARWISRRRERKPFLVFPSIGAPLVFSILTLVMFSSQPDHTAHLLPVFVISMSVLALVDGIVGVPWLDFIGSAIPGSLRGRMMGVQEMLYAVASIGVGAVVSYFLSEAAPPFPYNFARLAASASACYFIALLAFVPLVEPEHGPATRQQAHEWSSFLPKLRNILSTDRPFVNLVAVRVLNGFTGLALPFYILYATTDLGISPTATGFYLSAQILGSAVGSMILGFVYERRGSRLIIRTVTAIGFCAPLLALALPATGLRGASLHWLYSLVFLAAGVGGTSPAAIFIGYSNFVIDYVSPGERPAYLGLFNTLAGPTALAGMFGGLILERSSYPVVFIATACMLLIAQFLAYRLPEPRQRRTAVEVEPVGSA